MTDPMTPTRPSDPATSCLDGAWPCLEHDEHVRVPVETLAEARATTAVDLLREVVKSEGWDFATDPDGDCFFCGFPTDLPDHDEEDPECWVSRARRSILAELAS